ncbi:choice-of-anchor V domain-containing protein [Fodinibius sp. Rm-B-1B1-1]|uniref:choice-of-anchor V domain-containing protein n=1 Tax=Fodinibius alkaliphilus TaxID=3140241 RepID=UPI00315A21A4
MIRLFILPVVTLLVAFSYIEFTQGARGETAEKTSVNIYPEHLTGAFTGGFGEETCRSCHFDYDLNPGGGSLSLSGIPEKLLEGETVEIKIKVEHDELGAAGFQLSARYEDGSQAGEFMIEDDRLMFSDAVPDSLQYVQHSSEGTKPSQENKNSWTVRWAVPDNPKGFVIFNIAANAANGDQSEFGDYIYTREVYAEF